MNKEKKMIERNIELSTEFSRNHHMKNAAAEEKLLTSIQENGQQARQ